MNTDNRYNMTSKSAKPIQLVELLSMHFTIFGMCKGVFDICSTCYTRHTQTQRVTQPFDDMKTCFC